MDIRHFDEKHKNLRERVAKTRRKNAVRDWWDETLQRLSQPAPEPREQCLPKYAVWDIIAADGIPGRAVAARIDQPPVDGIRCKFWPVAMGRDAARMAAAARSRQIERWRRGEL